MIISASRRTDIPALYSEWLSLRLAAGFCMVPNPFNPRQVARVSLAPEDVDAMVFWTRHAKPMFSLLPTLQHHYRFYFQYTITGYGCPVEARTPPLEVATRTFRELAGRLVPGSVIWRYDPILVGPAFPNSDHLERFATIAGQLAGATRRVVISLVHIYRKTERRLAKLYTWDRDLCRAPADDVHVPELLAGLACIAGEHGMRIEACATPHDFSHLGIGITKCIDDRLLSELFGGTWPQAKDPGQRKNCRCIPSKDIGMADTCTFGCAYCYSTRSESLADARRRAHDPSATQLVSSP